MGHSDLAASHGKNNKLKDYLQLTKPSLNIMVVFSSVICYLLAPEVVEYDWTMILLLFIGGYLVTGVANAMNMAMEKDTDAVMKRTAKRPVAAGRMSVEEAWVFAAIAGVAGVFILGYYFAFLQLGHGNLKSIIYEK